MLMWSFIQPLGWSNRKCYLLQTFSAYYFDAEDNRHTAIPAIVIMDYVAAAPTAASADGQ